MHASRLVDGVPRTAARGKLALLLLPLLGGALVLALAHAADAAELRLDATPTQGGLVRAFAAPGVLASLDGRALRVDGDGAFVLGFGRDHGPQATLELVWPGGRRENRTLAIVPRQFIVQRIDGLPQALVSPDPELLARIKQDSRNAAEARQTLTPQSWWKPAFQWPVKGRISGVFGSQRVLNGEPRSTHYGVDIAAPTGTPIVAPADGIVRLADPDMVLTGQTLLIDHGDGVYSALVHMSKMTVAVGTFVRQGEVVGTVGATGRATGPHLHWGMTWHEVRVDPATIVGPMPE